MKALVLCAGLGTRLRPWTNELPKPLVPVAGIEPLYFTFTQLELFGVKDVVVNTHHLPEKISEFCKLLKSHFRSMTISLSNEKPEILGSGGGVVKVLKEKAPFKEGLLIVNGDILAHYNYLDLVSEHSSFSASFDEKFTKKYECVLVDSENRWCGSDPTKIPHSRLAHFFGVHYLSAEDSAWLAENVEAKNESLFALIYTKLKKIGHSPLAKEFALKGEDFWFDLNEAKLFDFAEKEIQAKHAAFWDTLLKRRHPATDLLKAREFWPLKSARKL